MIKRYNCLIFILDTDKEKYVEIQKTKMNKIQENI